MRKSELERRARSGQWEGVDTTKIPQEMVSSLSFGKGYRHSNLIGLAAQHGTLKSFPKELFDSVGLATPNDNMQESALHFAAISGDLKFIPQHLLTSENLAIPNTEGTTPIHYAALYLSLSQIPKNLLTQELLTRENRHGFGVLDFALFAYKDSMLELKTPSVGVDVDVGVDVNESGKIDKEEKTNERILHQKLDEQLRVILSKLSDQTLRRYQKAPTTTYTRERRRLIIDKELTRRQVIKKVSETEITL